MPDRVKEKLVELKKVLRECLHFNYDEFSCDMSLDVDLTAENLIAHGVTVQEWISVKDRLPEEPLQTVIVTNGKETCVAVYSVVYDEFGVMCGKGKAFGVTHWMPLPQPPKGE